MFTESITRKNKMKLVSPLQSNPGFSRIPGSSVPAQTGKRWRSRFLLPFAPLLALAAFAFGPASFGATSTWNGTTGADIGTAANWIGGLPSVSSGTGIGEWSGGVAGALNLTLSNANLAGGAGNAGITMSLTSAQTSAVSINTGAVTNGIRLNAITIASGAGALTRGDGATTAGDLTLTLGQGSGNRLFTNNSSNTATLNSDVVIGTGGGVARTIEFAGSGNWTVNNNLGGPNGTATITVVKSGAGTLTLTATNNFTGGITVQSGTLVTTGSAASSNGTVTLGDTTPSNSNSATWNTTGFNPVNNITVNAGSSGILAITGSSLTTSQTFSGNITLNNSLTVAALTSTFMNTYSGVISGTGGLNIGNTGITNVGGTGGVTLTGTNTYAGNTAINSGTLQIGGAGSLGTAGIYAGSIANNGTFKYSSSANQTFSGQITGTGGLLKQTSLTSTLTLSNSTSTFTGGIYLTEGTLSIASIANYGSASAVGYGTAGTSNIIFGYAADTGTLLYTGAGNTSNRTIQIGQNSATPAATDTGGATIQNDGSGALTFTAGTFNFGRTTASSGVGANRTLTLQGSNTGANTIQGVIRDNLVSGSGTGTATVGVTKSGAGTWVLSGTNSYTGATTVSEGTLLINGSTTGSAFSVSNAGSTLGGNGTITPGASHSLAVNSGSILAPGVTGTAGNLTIALTNTGDSAAFATGSTFAFDLGAPGTNDKLVFTGLAAGVHDVTFNSNVVNFSSLGGLAQGAYTLFTFDANNAYTGTLQIGTGLESFATSNFTYNANNIVLNVVPEPQTWALLAFSLTSVITSVRL